MASHGKVKPFNPKVDDWEVYEQQLWFYLHANGITDAKKKRSILLTVCGEQTFKLLRSLVPDGKLDVDTVTYKSLIDLLKSHYKKKQSVVVHRFNFNTRARKPTESIADYNAALRELALNCNFGEQARLEEMLRDRLVCGVKHEGIQRKLLAEGDISYTEALALAQSIEAAESDAKELVSKTPHSGTVFYTPASDRPLNKPNTSSFTNTHKSRKPTCYRCGSPHYANVCRHRETQCSYCKITGHLAKMCRSKARAEEREVRPKATPPSS